jgi:hypothetical protein
MAVVHTPGEPPNQGRICLLIMGCTWKSRKALSRERRMRGMEQAP